MDWNACDWDSFEACARAYFSELWGTELKEHSVLVGGIVPRKFDLVSANSKVVGDCKWLKNVPDPAAEWQAIAECIWLLQKVQAARTFMVFGRDIEVAERYLKRFACLITQSSSISSTSMATTRSTQSADFAEGM